MAFGLLAASILLTSCSKSPDAAPAGARSPGRFAGIGVFDAGRLWAQMAGPDDKADPAAAKLADDEHIIVVLDSHTGEVRQCGDHSGYCVAMNPWAGPDSSARSLPVRLRKHAADLEAEAQSNAAEPTGDTNASH
jgi:hypothetical protein